MIGSRLLRTIAVTAVAVLSTALVSTSAAASRADTTPPTAPAWGYAQGFYCLTLIAGVHRSTDDVTPQSQLRYEIYDNGVRIGSMVDQGAYAGVFAVLQMPGNGPGSHSITVRAIDAAGNRSAPTRTATVTGYYTPGCVPYHF